MGGGGSPSPSPLAASRGVSAKRASSRRCTDSGRAKKDLPRCRRSSIAATKVTAVETAVPRQSKPHRVFHSSRRRRRRVVDSASLLVCFI